MEDKVRRESQSLMERLFHEHAVKGKVNKDSVIKIMKKMQPDWTFDNEELNNVIAANDSSGSGNIDLEGFNKIALHFLLKQAKHDQDQFIHKHEIGPQDFSGEPAPAATD